MGPKLRGGDAMDIYDIYPETFKRLAGLPERWIRRAKRRFERGTFTHHVHAFMRLSGRDRLG